MDINTKTGLIGKQVGCAVNQEATKRKAEVDARRNATACAKTMIKSLHLQTKTVSFIKKSDWKTAEKQQ